MATRTTSKIIEHIRRTAFLPDGAGLSDGQLLGGFIEQRDEAAFAALVKRHGPMVWGVCRRLLSHDDAEDAFQATFLVLVRKAASIVPRETVANWIYGVAHRTALQARRTAARRRAREMQVAEMPEPTVSEQERWHDLQPLLDNELSRLPDKYRIVIVLCDLEGKTRKEAARQLCLPEGTVGSRLARARTMLAKRLAQRGLAVSVGGLATALSQNAASASVPASVVSSTIKAATAVAVGQAAAAGAISVKVAALTEGVVKAMLLSKLKLTATIVVLACLLTIGAGGFLPRLVAIQPGPGDSAKGNRKLAAYEQAAKSAAEGKKQKYGVPLRKSNLKPAVANKAKIEVVYGTVKAVDKRSILLESGQRFLLDAKTEYNRETGFDVAPAKLTDITKGTRLYIVPDVRAKTPTARVVVIRLLQPQIAGEKKGKATLITLTDADDGKAFSVKTGDLIVIRLTLPPRPKDAGVIGPNTLGNTEMDPVGIVVSAPPLTVGESELVRKTGAANSPPMFAILRAVKAGSCTVRCTLIPSRRVFQFTMGVAGEPVKLAAPERKGKLSGPTSAGEKSPIISPAMGTKNSAKDIDAARVRAALTAAKDIKAGKLRILYYGKPWPNGKPLVDDTTGYRVQIVAGCTVGGAFVAEVEAYNKTMRDWHTKIEKEKSSRTDESNHAAAVRAAQPKGAYERPQDTWRTLCIALRAKDKKALVACSITLHGVPAEVRDALVRFAIARQKMQEIAVARFGRVAMRLVPDNFRLSFLDKWCKGEGQVKAKISGNRAILTVTADVTFTVACRREGKHWKIDYAECGDFQKKDAKEYRRMARDFRKDAAELDAITQGIRTKRIRSIDELKNALGTRLPPQGYSISSPNRSPVANGATDGKHKTAIDWKAFYDQQKVLLSNVFAKSIGGLPRPEKAAAIKRLHDALGFKHVEIRRRAALTLGYLGDKSGVPAMIDDLSKATGRDRDNVVVALRVLKDRRAIPALRKALRDPSPYVRGIAVAALGELKATKAYAEIVALTKDKGRTNTRPGTLDCLRITPAEMACYALGALGEQRAVPVLIERLADKDLQEQVRQALEALTGQKLGNNPEKWRLWWKGQDRRR